MKSGRLKMPITISYFYCENCSERWRVFRNEKQFKSRCQDCGELNTYMSHRLVTDYRSDIKCYGFFQCQNQKCDNTWTSSSSWIWYKQGCYKCGKRNLPYALKELIKNYNYSGGSNKGEDKNHKSELCEKCISLGYSCKQKSNEDDSYYYRGYQYY
jgi:hypothetical protein